MTPPIIAHLRPGHVQMGGFGSAGGTQVLSVAPRQTRQPSLVSLQRKFPTNLLCPLTSAILGDRCEPHSSPHCLCCVCPRRQSADRLVSPRSWNGRPGCRRVEPDSLFDRAGPHTSDHRRAHSPAAGGSTGMGWTSRRTPQFACWAIAVDGVSDSSLGERSRDPRRATRSEPILQFGCVGRIEIGRRG